MIQAIERYGREDAYHLIGSSVDLRHTKETISWVIEELQNPAAERYENYVFNLNRVLCHADPALLTHRDTEILESGHFYRDMRDHFTRRLELLSWDEAACWRQLEQICEDGKDKRYANEVDLSFANDILEALARIGDEVEQRVLSVLSQRIENFEQNPMKWMEPLMVKLAGLLQMDAAIPMILGKLHEDDILLAGYCIEALSRVGTDAVVAVVAEDFADAERHFRLCAANVFENIHSDLSVEKAVDLLATEKDRQRWYEPERGKPQYEYTDEVVAWCRERGIRLKRSALSRLVYLSCLGVAARFERSAHASGGQMPPSSQAPVVSRRPATWTTHRQIGPVSYPRQPFDIGCIEDQSFLLVSKLSD